MLNNASAYHYDRSGGGYPEGIDEAVAQGFKNKSKYDRDGGAVGTVTIPGDEASEIMIRLSGSGSNPVSYTHLDVYKRQLPYCGND